VSNYTNHSIIHYVIQDSCPPHPKYRCGYPKLLQLETPLVNHSITFSKNSSVNYAVEQEPHLSQMAAVVNTTQMCIDRHRLIDAGQMYGNIISAYKLSRLMNRKQFLMSQYLQYKLYFVHTASVTAAVYTITSNCIRTDYYLQGYTYYVT